MSGFYPASRASKSYHLQVDDVHSLYIEESGNATGLPVIFLHGGPGAGCESWHRRFFDPQRYRIILFDQRGCGKSRPHASLENNTTWDLVEDVEKIRTYLGIDRCVLFGGSWGSTLALAYAEKYPENVLSMILRGIFLARNEDVSWFYQQGASRLFPDFWQDFIALVVPEKRHQMVSSYYELLTSEDEQVRNQAALAWSVWEGRTANLIPNDRVMEHFGDAWNALSIARIECHYFMHQSFFQPNQLLRDAHRLAGIPNVIVHGRYDVICPLEQAWALHHAWPGSELKIINDAGHSALHDGIRAALVAAADEFATKLLS